MKSIKKIWLLLTIIAVIYSVGCDKKENVPNMDFIYPLSVGNSWQYNMVYTTDYDSLANANGFVDTTYYSTGSVEIKTKEVIFDSLDAYNLTTTVTENGNQIRGNEYYNNEDDGLFCYGYTNGSLITPKKSKKYAYIIFDGKRFKDVREIVDYLKKGIFENDYSKNDSIYYDPVKSLEYPLKEDNQWIYRKSGEPFRIDKKIVGKQSVDVPAGQFYCWKIQWTYPEESFNDDVEFYDFISKNGLVKRVFEIRNSECVDVNGNVVGHINSREEEILTDYHIVD